MKYLEYNQAGTGPFGRIHACYCIGCCRECGRCVTDPRHTPDRCAKLEELNRLAQEVYEGVENGTIDERAV